MTVTDTIIRHGRQGGIGLTGVCAVWSSSMMIPDICQSAQRHLVDKIGDLTVVKDNSTEVASTDATKAEALSSFFFQCVCHRIRLTIYPT